MKDGSVPLVNRITNEIAFVRYHGRNHYGWTKKDMSDQEWRDVRYLYDYNEQELIDLAQKAQILAQKLRKFTSYLTIILVVMQLIMPKHISDY